MPAANIAAVSKNNEIKDSIIKIKTSGISSDVRIQSATQTTTAKISRPGSAILITNDNKHCQNKMHIPTLPPSGGPSSSSSATAKQQQQHQHQTPPPRLHPKKRKFDPAELEDEASKQQSGPVINDSDHMHTPTTSSSSNLAFKNGNSLYYAIQPISVVNSSGSGSIVTGTPGKPILIHHVDCADKKIIFTR